MAQPTTDPIAVEFAGLPDEARTPGGERGGSLEFVNALLKRWRFVVGLPVLAAILSAIVVLLLPPRYTATVTFVPEQRAPSRGGGAAGGGAGLVGLAGQLGIPLGMDPTQSPRFYAEVLTSRELLSRVLLTKFADPRHPAATRRSEDTRISSTNNAPDAGSSSGYRPATARMLSYRITSRSVYICLAICK